MRNQVMTKRAPGGISAVGFQGNVRKREDAQRVVKVTVKHFGKLNILVNAAAGNFLVRVEDLSPNGFKTGIEIFILPILWMPNHVFEEFTKSVIRFFFSYEIDNNIYPCKIHF